MQALAGYTEWKFEYVKCDWSDCFDELENGEIDIMGERFYSDERAQKMLFSDEPMGEEKIYSFMLIYRIWILGCLILSLWTGNV